MSYIQESIISILRERSVRRHLSVVVCMIAVATVLAVFWTLHLNGITLASGDLTCGLTEHTHTTDCYAWVPVETDTEENTEPEETETETVAGTEIVTETETESETETVTGTEETTESVLTAGTEAVTEEETETAQVGDTKIINGVEYIYTLICGMEEHTHTDACYESASSEEDSAAEEVTETETLSETETEEDSEEGSSITAGVTETFYQTMVLMGFASGGSEPMVTSLAAGAGTTGDTYYFAETTTLATAAANQDENYIVYTEIGDTYYVVSADNTLVECTYLGDESSGYDVDSKLVDDTADTGMYCWTDSNGNLCFKCTTLSSADVFDDYQWILSGTVSDSSSGSGMYTIYNSENSVYIAPQDVGISETVERTNSYQYGKSYDLDDNKVVIYTFTYNKQDGTSGIFWVEVFDEYGNYITTTSDSRYWAAGNASAANTTLTTSQSLTLDDGETYTAVVSKDTISESGNVIYTITYYDSDGSVALTYVAKSTGLSGSTYTHFTAEYGSYDVGVTYGILKTANGTDNSGVEDTYNTNSSFEATSTTTLDDVQSDEAELKGDFDITYSFYTKSGGNDFAYNYVFALENGNGKVIYINASPNANASTQVTAYQNGTAASLSWVRSTVYEYGHGPNWRWTMINYGATVTINVVRQQNTFVVHVTIISSYTNYGDNGLLNNYTITFEDEDFDGCYAYLHLTGLNCTVSGISISEDSATYDIESYEAYGIISSLSAFLSMDVDGSGDGWTAQTTYENATVTLAGDSTNSASFVKSAGSGSNTTFYLARVKGYTVHFDPTNGSTMVNSNNYNATVNYYVSSSATETTAAPSTGSYALRTFADAAGDYYIRIPTATASSNYAYKLQGWYDIYNQAYYSSSDAGSVVYVTEDTVMYADWVINDSSYTTMDGTESGALPEDNKLDTSSFITTDVFDYNELVNLYSAYLLDESGTYETYVNTSGHAELWSLAYDSTNSAYLTNNLGSASWGFLFINNKTGTRNFSGLDYQGSLSYALNRGGNNYNGGFWQGILTGIYTRTSGAVDLREALFDTSSSYTASTTPGQLGSGTLGVNYLGTGNYLFQYDSDTGYYYYDSSQNAAYYYNNRFYLFEYTIMGSGTNTEDDFLPFNYPSSANAVIESRNTNYFFGLKSKIDFYLPDDIGGSNSNQTVSGDMVFKFIGDDDVWVYVDGILLLDLGGTHDKVYGEIDFSNGIVTIVDEDHFSTSVTKDSDGVYQVTGSSGVTTYTFQELFNLYSQVGDTNATTTYAELTGSGAHTLTMCYLERGGGQSNLVVLMSISPMYSLTLTKTDYKTSAILPGAEFTVYTAYDFEDSGNNKTASLLTSLDSSGQYTSTFTTDNNGQLTIYGLRPNQTYYLVETQAPEGYPLIYKVLKVVVDSSGNATVTVLNSDGSELGTETYDYSSGDNITTLSNSEWQFLKTGSLEVTQGSKPSEGDDYNVAFTVANDYQYELAGTGGTGISRYRQAGITIVAISVIGLLSLAFYHFVWIPKTLHDSI